jgi:mannose-6-phosphate isomerase-like protein (cupin superfamily)
MQKYTTTSLHDRIDEIAPDGAEIRLLSRMDGGSVCHCSLAAGVISWAVRHETVEEIWYFLDGEGEVWRKSDGQESVVAVRSGLCLTIPPGTHFQFRNTGTVPLTFLCITMPPWPGDEEAIRVDDYWA